jgi:hypothetical protein
MGDWTDAAKLRRRFSLKMPSAVTTKKVRMLEEEVLLFG